MEAFKEQELERKGFKSKNEIVLPDEEEKPKTKGLIVPTYLIDNPDTCVGSVKHYTQ